MLATRSWPGSSIVHANGPWRLRFVTTRHSAPHATKLGCIASWQQNDTTVSSGKAATALAGPSKKVGSVFANKMSFVIRMLPPVCWLAYSATTSSDKLRSHEVGTCNIMDVGQHGGYACCPICAASADWTSLQLDVDCRRECRTRSRSEMR